MRALPRDQRVGRRVRSRHLPSWFLYFRVLSAGCILEVAGSPLHKILPLWVLTSVPFPCSSVYKCRGTTQLLSQVLHHSCASLYSAHIFVNSSLIKLPLNGPILACHLFSVGTMRDI